MDQRKHHLIRGAVKTKPPGPMSQNPSHRTQARREINTKPPDIAEPGPREEMRSRPNLQGPMSQSSSQPQPTTAPGEEALRGNTGELKVIRNKGIKTSKGKT
ncbi:hypothetical protein WMY93_004291 [Mugilogobius chulae]|uniref:Uncharacterized protein n=1 Tax=Mugilogobius chulae TaxID=88201 RepID=A0AAW0Q333_9GOBI